MRDRPSFVQPSSFFLLTFVLSWLIWIPLVLSHFGVKPFQALENASPIVRLLGVLMPAAAALILTARAGGKAASAALWKRFKIWRVGWIWWFVAALLQPLLLVVTGLIFNAAGQTPAIQPEPVGGMAAFVVSVVFLLIATLGEEIGWRGVALPALQQRSTAFKASIILGVLWAAWHIPFWLLLDTFDQFGWTYLLLNFLMVVPFTFYITWFFNHSRQSLLLPVVFHLSFNIVNTVLFPVTLHIGAFGFYIAMMWAISFFIYRRLEPANAGTRQAAPALNHPG